MFITYVNYCDNMTKLERIFVGRIIENGSYKGGHSRLLISIPKEVALSIAEQIGKQVKVKVECI